jgi:hypothetical protein
MTGLYLYLNTGLAATPPAMNENTILAIANEREVLGVEQRFHG